MTQTRPKHQLSRTEMTMGGGNKTRFKNPRNQKSSRSIYERYEIGTEIWSGSLSMHEDRVRYSIECGPTVEEDQLGNITSNDFTDINAQFYIHIPIKIVKGQYIYINGTPLGPTEEWEK